MTTQIIAHRGASAYAPENTMEAFKKAREMKANGIETDVHLTKDQVPVLMHDERVNRTSNGKGLIHHHTLAELEQLDIGSWFSPSFSHARILTLEQFLTWIKETDMHAHIELKNNKINYPNIETIVHNCIVNQHMQDRTTVSSFNFESIQRFTRLTDTIEGAFLLSKMNEATRALLSNQPVDALHIKHSLLKRNMITFSKNNQLPLRVFTINKVATMIKCFKAGVHGIFTDVPDLAYETRKNRKNRGE